MEHPIGINKSASALVGAGLGYFGGVAAYVVQYGLLHSSIGQG